MGILNLGLSFDKLTKEDSEETKWAQTQEKPLRSKDNL